MATLDCPYLNRMVDSCSRQNIALFNIVHGADPSFRVSTCHLKHWFGLFGVPNVNGAILASSHEPFLVDGSNSIYGVVVTFVDYFGLFLSFPGYDLLVIARADKVFGVEAVQIEYLACMLIIGSNQASLGHIPMFESEISTD